MPWGLIVKAVEAHADHETRWIVPYVMHYAFDRWLEREFPVAEFECFAGDAVIHRVSEYQARKVLAALHERMSEVGLELHPDKTRIVYCEDSRRPGSSGHESRGLTAAVSCAVRGLLTAFCWPGLACGQVDHLAFGYGMHTCAGLSHARLEAAAVIDALLPRVSRFELAGQPRQHYNPVVRGLETLPLHAELN